MKRTPILLILLALVLAACPSATVTGVSVTSVPAATKGLLSVFLNQSATIKATVTGTGAFNAAVQWSLSPNDGSLVWKGDTATFTPKAAITYTLTAISQADTGKRASLIATVTAPDVLVIADPTNINPNQPSNLTANVKDIGGTVTWSVDPTTGTSFTPPTPGNTTSFSSSLPGTYTITATSVINPSLKGTVTVQVMSWTGSRLIGTGASDTVTGSATDADGNAYVSGFTTGALQGLNQGQFDAFVAKFDASGTQVWVRQLGSSKDDLAYGVAVDGGGNVYVVGTTAGTLPTASSAGSDDAFVAKYDPSGTRQWVSQFGTSGFENAFGVALGPDGSVFVAGDTDGSLNGTNPDLGNTDAFVTKLDPSTGARTWTKQLGVIGNDTAYGVAVDANGNVDIAGSTEGALPGNVSSLGRDAFIAQYDPNGTQTWVRQFGSSKEDEIKGVAVDGSGNIFVAGQTDGNLSGSSAGLGDAFVAKYAPSGTKAWLSQFGSSADDGASGIAVDTSGNAYVSGQTDGNLPGNSSAGGTDAFLTKFDASGASQWIKQIGSSSTDVGFAASIADRGSSAVLAGYAEGSPFDGLTGAGGREGFIAKYKPDGSR